MPTPLSRPLRLGTRGSPLALAQARLVADALRQAHGWGQESIEIVPITTTGDIVQDRPLSEIGGKSLWTKELDRCLADQRTDMSVHSMKDVETVRPPEFGFAAILPRADRRDRLIGAQSLKELPHGARIGTSSPRRAAQIRARRPDLQPVTIRGNVATRLAKVERGEVHATLLAAAGLDRLGMDAVGTPVEDMLTAPGQGAIGVEIVCERSELRELIAAIDHRPAHAAVQAERDFLLRLGGDCHSPVAAEARWFPDAIKLEAEILLPDGSEAHRLSMNVSQATQTTPADVARVLLDRASPELRSLFAA